MKIAFIVNKFPALSETFILNQITGLIDRGHEVDIYAGGAESNSKVHDDVIKYNLLERTRYHREIIQNMPKSRILKIRKGMKYVSKYILKRPSVILRTINIFKHGKKAASFNLLFQAIPFLDKDRYDIIHCHFGPNGSLGALLKDVRALSGKVITTFHGYDLTSYLVSRGSGVYEKLFKIGDLFLPISNRWKEKLIRLGCPPEKILIHRMGIDVGRFGLSQDKHQENSITLLTVARLVEKKGVQYGIQAVAKITGKHPNIEYRIAGDGPLKKVLGDMIAKAKVNGIIRLLGWQDQQEISVLMGQADILLAPSVTGEDGDQEGIPVVLMEAMARGLPVISTFHSGIPELVIDGKTGLLVNEHDADALSEKLEYLITHPEMREKMGQEGRKYVETNYDINKLNDRLVETYQELISS